MRIADCSPVRELSAKLAGKRQLGIGVALTAVLAAGAAVVATSLSRWGLSGHSPPISPTLCAIVIGLLWRNLLGVKEEWLPGFSWMSGALLRFGIALLGLRLTLAGVQSIASIAVPVVAGCIAVALLTGYVVCKALHISPSLGALIAAGTAICGGTAIMAVAPVVRSKSSETAVALTCVMALGSIGMMMYPWIAHAIFQDDRFASVFLGTSIHDTSQVLGASLIYAQQFGRIEVVEMAVVTKMLRNFSLLLLVPAFIWMTAQPREAAANAPRMRIFPMFMLVFIGLAVSRTLFEPAVLTSNYAQLWRRGLEVAQLSSEILLVVGMTAVGLSVSMRDAGRIGIRAAIAAAAVALAVVSCSLSLTLLVQHLSVANSNFSP